MDSRLAGKKYKYIEHLSDIGLEFYGNTVEELFENAAEGMFSVMSDLKLVKPLEKRNVKITSENAGYEDLLILWLERLLYWYEVDNILFSEFKVKRIDMKNHNLILDAGISGEKIDLDKHKITVSVKAPTYHMLEIKKDNRRHKWEGRIIFDV
jgi:SHS2 domain-containing protein